MSEDLGVQCPHCMGTLKRKGVHSESGRQRYQCQLCNRKTTYPIETAEGYNLKRVSSLRDGATGEEKIRWEIRDADKAKQEELMQEAIKAMAEKIPPAEPVPAPEQSNEDLLTAYVLSDYHIGQLSWPDECGASWDTEIAENTLTAWFQEAIRSSPDSETGLFIQLGDFLDIDGMEPVTPTSGNVLDVDSRYPYLVRVAIRAMRRIIRMMLEKHKNVVVWACDANHDPTAGIWLREWMQALYEDEPRVTVETSPESYYGYEFGKVGIYGHHGHKRKVNDVCEVIASRFREMYGRTKHSYVHMGHRHHAHAKETNLAIVEQHQTLAAPTDYAARGGYAAGRSAQAITYHREYGEVGRVRITPEMVS